LDVLVVETGDVRSDQGDPVQSHLRVLMLPVRFQRIELLRDLFNLPDKVLNKPALALRLNVTLKLYVHEEVAGFMSHVWITILNGN
jgi:hypothetical protein